MHINKFIALIDGNGDDAAGARIGICRQIGLFDDAFFRDHHDKLIGHKFANRQRGADFFTRREIDEIDDGLAFRGASSLRDLVHFQPVHLAGVGKDQQIVVR